jgi:hypothetical protein
MGDLIISVDKTVVTPQVGVAPLSSLLGPSEQKGEMEVVFNEEQQPLVSMAECRICQEEDLIQNLDDPCACIGSLKVFFFFWSIVDCSC